MRLRFCACVSGKILLSLDENKLKKLFNDAIVWRDVDRWTVACWIQYRRRPVIFQLQRREEEVKSTTFGASHI